MLAGDYLAETYLTGSAKEAGSLFVEAEDLLGQEQYAWSQARNYLGVVQACPGLLAPNRG